MTNKYKSHFIKIIGGPTASGKSSFAIDMAEKCNGVIINADSMQVYDALHILTAHPSEEEKKQIPHKLYGYLPPSAPCSAGNWVETAIPLIKQILEENKTPIIVGGTGLYIKALIEGLSPIPDIPDDIRQKASKKQKQLGNPGFHEELSKIDPVMAQRLHPMHTARLVRAWEVIQATGKSLADWQKIPKTPPPENWIFDVTLVIPKRDTLYKRCNNRFEWMIENGVIDEVKGFSKKLKSGKIPQNVPITKALGLAEIMTYLNNETTLENAIEKAQAKTRQYAKRQTTWFKHQVKPANNIKNITITENGK